MTMSQNGWTASSNPSAIGVNNPKVPGTNVYFPGGVKGGDVTTVLMYVAEQFNAHVQALHSGWCWGYDYKPIEGSSEVSNHASGTAIDMNAPDHPMGKAGTFTSAQVAVIRKILSYCGGVVRWGGDYTGRKDEMHFEINGNAAAVKKLAAKIKGTPATPTPPAPKPPTQGATVKLGDTGTEVRKIQTFLRTVFPAYRETVSVQRGTLIAVDGTYGAQTVAWVKEFQTRAGITVDGIVGPVTLAKMRGYGLVN